MADNIKLLGSSFALTTANNAGNAKQVRVVNTTAAPTLITQKYANGTVIGTLVLGVSGSNFDNGCILKQPSDTLESNAASGVFAVSVGFY